MNEAMVMRVREDESCSGSGRQDSVPASVRELGTIVVSAVGSSGHLKNAKKVVSPRSTTSVRTSFLECKKDALVGMNHP
jgi:hypothetical protein